MTLDDVTAIHQLVHRYSRAIDTKDWELLRSVFAPDGRVTFAFDQKRFPGENELSWTADEFVEHIKKSHDGSNAFHAMSNVSVDFDSDDTAQVTTYGRSIVAPFARIDGGFESIGFYTDEALRTDDGWRIRTRRYERRFLLST
jgi:SnoaL-like domain